MTPNPYQSPMQHSEKPLPTVVLIPWNRLSKHIPYVCMTSLVFIEPLRFVLNWMVWYADLFTAQHHGSAGLLGVNAHLGINIIGLMLSSCFLAIGIVWSLANVYWCLVRDMRFPRSASWYFMSILGIFLISPELIPGMTGREINLELMTLHKLTFEILVIMLVPYILYSPRVHQSFKQF